MLPMLSPFWKGPRSPHDAKPVFLVVIFVALLALGAIVLACGFWPWLWTV